MGSARERRLEEKLAEFIKPIRNIPFEVVIKGLCDVSVEPFDISAGDNRKVLTSVVQATRDACSAVQRQPIERPRPNEVGNDMEGYVIQGLARNGLNAAPPRTKAGGGKATGYPDIRIDTGGLPIFLEVKTYNSANHTTTQRSFYLSPSANPKVYEDGHHILVGFEIERNGNHYRPVAFEVVDLYGLECDMKSEFNSDNKRLYKEERVLAKERVT